MEATENGRLHEPAQCGDPPDFRAVGFGEPCPITFDIAPGAECDPAILGFVASGSRSTAGLLEDDLHPGEWFRTGACWITQPRSESPSRSRTKAATGNTAHRNESGSSLDIVRQEKLDEAEYARWLETRPDQRSVTLPLETNDPADRIIVATALEYGATLITADAKLRAYRGLETVWD